MLTDSGPWLHVTIAGVCALALILLIVRSFQLARQFDAYLVKPVRRLSTRWQSSAKLASAVLRPRNLGPVVLLVGVLLWDQQNNAEAFFCVLMTTGMAAAELLKSVIRRPRPANDSVSLYRIKTLSFPSGHASSVLLASLTVVSVFLPHPAVVLLVVAAGLSVGITRVYLRVHYASDVLAGWLFAVGWWQLSLLVK